MKKKSRLMPLAASFMAAGLLLAGCASGDSGAPESDGASATVGELELSGFWAKETSLDMSAAYGEIVNNGDSDDALVSVTADGVPEVQLHETVNGVMREVDEFPIQPGGGKLVLEPGGNHIMLMQLEEPLVAGKTVDLTLNFKSGATAKLTAPIRSFTGEEGLALGHFWVKESSLDMSGGFGRITNNGGTDDALIGASAPGIPEIQLHETVDGKMRQVQEFPIPANGVLVLEPGGNHLMFMNLQEPLKAGDTIDITLKFKSGATETVTAKIKPLSSEDGGHMDHDHSDHDHSDHDH